MSTKIYVLRDPRISGRESIFYVGKTSKQLNERLNLHICNAQREKYTDYYSYKAKLIRNILKDGLVPIIKMIENVFHENWAEREIYWIEKMNSIGCMMLNAHPGGQSGPPSGGKRDPAIVQRISKALMGHPVSEETRRKIAESHMGGTPWNKGRPWDEETKAKISKANTGKVVSEETKAKLSVSLRALGRKMSDYNKQKLKEGRRPFTEEEKKRMSAAQKERFRKNPKPSHKLSEESKKKISESRKKYLLTAPKYIPSEETRKKISEAKTEYYRKRREQNEVS